MNNKSNVWSLISWLFGIFVFAIGILNMLWGNDPWFGAFLVLLSLIYFPPKDKLVRKSTRFSILWIVKIVLDIFIIWASLGVGELFNKIDLMMKDL